MTHVYKLLNYAISPNMFSIVSFYPLENSYFTKGWMVHYCKEDAWFLGWQQSLLKNEGVKFTTRAQWAQPGRKVHQINRSKFLNKSWTWLYYIYYFFSLQSQINLRHDILIFVFLLIYFNNHKILLISNELKSNEEKEKEMVKATAKLYMGKKQVTFIN